MTRKSQDFTAVDLIRALEGAWRSVRTHHPDVPQVVIVVGSGTATRRTKWGHYGALRWQHGDDRLPEVLVSGEGLKRPATEILTTLIHEAAHAVADVRKIQDTSRQGRWHNRRFAALARELGLEPRKDDSLGWSPCTLLPETTLRYAADLLLIEGAISAYRHPDSHGLGATRSGSNAVACTCQCPRRIRVAPSVLDEGGITCDVCGEPFEPTA